MPGDDVDYDGDLTPIIKQWTSVYAATEDVHDAARFEREVPADKRVNTRGIEVGQIFYFGTKYSDAMKALVAGPDGVEVPIHGGSYGVGVSRLVGAIIEACHDDAGIKWPEAVAPFTAVILNLKQGDAAVDAACEKLYRELSGQGRRRALRRHRPARRREIRRRRPDRHSLADSGRPQGPCRGQGRDQAAQRRLARESQPGGSAWRG